MTSRIGSNGVGIQLSDSHDINILNSDISGHIIAIQLLPKSHNIMIKNNNISITHPYRTHQTAIALDQITQSQVQNNTFTVTHMVQDRSPDTLLGIKQSASNTNKTINNKFILRIHYVASDYEHVKIQTQEPNGKIMLKENGTQCKDIFSDYYYTCTTHTDA